MHEVIKILVTAWCIFSVVTLTVAYFTSRSLQKAYRRQENERIKRLIELGKPVKDKE